ncbi:hypothetical protein QNO07_04640 [Streptomyces sp. 549]|uniref:hypothetical protein n=1 Tax=Streptomyces sp. 549 TaxID=3049076 RepID=UPI0024C2F390|nr:hypothetical protein [Streptomyces sp. 549]MDK1472720.1 hypothetical protein [Streptomyces sp. 549]
MTASRHLAPTRLFVATSALEAAVHAAALHAGLFPGPARNLLVTADTSPVPEVSWTATGPLPTDPRFDGVLSWNAAVHPRHPASWQPRESDEPLWERLLRQWWQLGDGPVELVAADPEHALAQVFADSPVDVCVGSTAAYLPSAAAPDTRTGTRVGRLLHLDLLPGVTPLLLDEFGVPARTVPADALRAVLADHPAPSPLAGSPGSPTPGSPTPGSPTPGSPTPDSPPRGTALLLAGPDKRSAARTLSAAADLGHHDATVQLDAARLLRSGPAWREQAEAAGVRLHVLPAAEPAALGCRLLRPAAVIGEASPELLLAHAVFDVPAHRVGSVRATAGGSPERAALAVVADALWPSGDRPAASPSELAGRLRALAYLRRPAALPELRGDALRHLDDLPPALVPRRTRAALGLPGGLPAPFTTAARTPVARRTVRRLRALRPPAE